MTDLADGTRDRRGARLRRRIRTGDIIVVILFLSIVLVVMQFDFTELFAIVYHPVAGLILLVVLVEFIWLKSGDRTRIYKIEIDKLRRSRREDEELLRRARKLVGDAIAPPKQEDPPPPDDWQGRAADLKRDLDERL